MRNLAILTILLATLVACGGGKSSQNATSAPAASQAAGSEGASGGSMSGDSAAGGASESTAAIPNCGAVKAVWVNLKTHVYHEPGDPWYGKTKSGEYLCPSQAKAQGFHRAGAMAGSSHP